MAKKYVQDYYCNVISEDVKISLKNKANIGMEHQNESII